MTKEELEEFLEMVKQDAFLEEYGWGQPAPSPEYVSKWWKRFDELQNKLYTALGIK